MLKCSPTFVPRLTLSELVCYWGSLGVYRSVLPLDLCDQKAKHSTLPRALGICWVGQCRCLCGCVWKLFADYFKVRGVQYLVVVDRYSSWPLVYRAKDLSARELGRILRRVFISCRVAEEFTSDGATKSVAMCSRSSARRGEFGTESPQLIIPTPTSGQKWQS